MLAALVACVALEVYYSIFVNRLGNDHPRCSSARYAALENHASHFCFDKDKKERGLRKFAQITQKAPQTIAKTLQSV